MAHLLNFTLLAGEALLYFAVMATLFRMRHRFGIGIFFCALGTMHFLETYLASILYLQFPLGITISPGSAVLFSGKLVMLLLVYIREDAAAVRQPIYGLLLGNFLMVGLVTLLRFHDVTPAVPDKLPDFQFMREMGWLMVWGTILLFIDSILIVLVYERAAAWFGDRIVPRILVSAALVLTFDQLGFFAALHVFLGVPLHRPLRRLDRQDGGGAVLWIARRRLSSLCRDAAPCALGERPNLSDVFDTLTYRQRYEALLELTGRDSLTGVLDRGRFDHDGKARRRAGGRRPPGDERAGHRHRPLQGDQRPPRPCRRRRGARARSPARSARATRDTDRVYRYGGEEFIVVCEGLAHGPALLAAERLRLRIAATEIQGIADRVTASIGVATTPDDGRDLTELFATADGRLYGAKEAGRNRVLGRLIERAEPAPGFGQPIEERAAKTA